MTLAYIRLYLALGIGHLSILQLNDLQKEIDGVIKTRCDTLLEEACPQRIESLDDTGYHGYLSHWRKEMS